MRRGFFVMISEYRIHELFRISVILKGLHALIEIAGGIAFYLISSQTILLWVNASTRNELVEDPRDMVATQLLAAAQGLTGSTQSFYAFYLISHGVIKIILVMGLLREKLIAYPASLAVLAGFIGYQLHRYSYTHSFGLILLTILDIAVMVLVWHEWRLLRRHLPVD